MAEFNYFGTRADSLALVQDLLSRGDLRAYVETGPHEAPEAGAFPAWNEALQALLQRWRRVYLFGPFSTHPPVFRRQDTGVHAGKFFLSESGGGPLITLSFARLSTDGTNTLLPGSFSTQPTYEIEPDHWHRPSEALKAAYADLVKRMKRHLVRHHGLWIGKEARQLLQEGKAQLPAHLQAQLTPARPKARRTSSASTPPAPPVPKAAQGSS